MPKHYGAPDLSFGMISQNLVQSRSSASYPFRTPVILAGTHALMVLEMVVTMWPGAKLGTGVIGVMLLLAAALALTGVTTRGSTNRQASGQTETRWSLGTLKAAERTRIRLGAIDLTSMALVELTIALTKLLVVEGAEASRTASLAGLVVAAGWPAARCAIDRDGRHWRSGGWMAVSLLAMLAACS